MTRYKAIKFCLEDLGLNSTFVNGTRLGSMFRKLDKFYGNFNTKFSTDKLIEERNELNEHLERYGNFIYNSKRPGASKGQEDIIWVSEYKSYILGIYLEVVDILLVGGYLLANDIITEKMLSRELAKVKNKLMMYNVDEYLDRKVIDYDGEEVYVLHSLIEYKADELVTAIDTAYKKKLFLATDQKHLRYRNMFTVLYPEKDIKDLTNLKLIRKFIFSDMFRALMYLIEL